MSLHSLPETIRRQLEPELEQLMLPRGTLLFKENRLEAWVYFLEEGLARAFLDSSGKDITFWFGREGDVLLSYRSYIYGAPGYENMELLEDALVYRIHQDRLRELYAGNLEMANWGRRLAEAELLKAELRFIHRLTLPASGRYQLLLEQEPELLRRVPLGYLASYLGMTQVSLSRIRKAK